jgi:hypothetical protein
MPDYPDVLGTITQGARLTLDMADLALAIRPGTPAAAKPFDVILLIQNSASCDLDVTVRLIIPEKDLKGARDRFVTKMVKKIAVGLRAAEVGYVVLPMMAQALTTPGAYTVGVEVEVKRTEKVSRRIRNESGGAPLDLNRVGSAARAEIDALRTLPYSVNTQGKPGKTNATITTQFTLSPPGIAPLVEVGKADWKSLWTMHEGLDDEGLAEQARKQTAIVLPQLNRRNLLIPLIKAVQQRAEAADYRLWAGEAVAIAKMMVYTLETGQPAVTADNPTVTYPQWFVRMCQVLIQQPNLVNNVETLVIDMLFRELIYDTVLGSFAILKPLTTEDLGNQQEMFDFAGELSKTFMREGEPLDYVHAYLPVILAGMMNNQKMLVAEENPLDTLELLVNARIEREEERFEGNQFVFDLADQMLDRALALQDTSLQRYFDPIERLQHKRTW